MNRLIQPIDITNFPDLVRIVEEMKDAKEPRILKKGDDPVAMLMPMKTPAERHHAVESFDFRPLDKVKADLLDAGISNSEVQDMIEAMSELPQYAGRGIK